METKCKKHRGYKAIRVPRSGCPECIKMWEEAHPGMSVAVHNEEKELEELVEKNLAETIQVQDVKYGYYFDNPRSVYGFSLKHSVVIDYPQYKLRLRVEPKALFLTDPSYYGARVTHCIHFVKQVNSNPLVEKASSAEEVARLIENQGATVSSLCITSNGYEPRGRTPLRFGEDVFKYTFAMLAKEYGQGGKGFYKPHLPCGVTVEAYPVKESDTKEQ